MTTHTNALPTPSIFPCRRQHLRLPNTIETTWTDHHWGIDAARGPVAAVIDSGSHVIVSMYDSPKGVL